LESADRAFGKRWADGGSDCGGSGQEPADGSPLAPPLYGRGGRGAFEGRDPAPEFLRFLKLIDQRTPAGLALHLIVDNYATHKTPAVKRWLKAHPRFHLHVTPTSASWLNMVERFFAEITRNRIRRGAFKSTAELKDAIMQYLEKHNANPKPFVWTKSADKILEKVARAKQALESQH
jgi:transposase